MFSGHYCPECGQKAHVHRSIAAIGYDIMHGVLHLDGKLWDTRPLLAFKSGDLTRRYIAGERAKFVSLMAMFLFTVFAMFAVFQMVGISAPTDFGKGFIDGYNDESSFQTEMQQQITAAAVGQGDRGARTVGKGHVRRRQVRWLLIPLSVPFLWLMFAWRRQFKAHDHAVFVTYSLSVISLLFIALSVLYVIPGAGDWIGVVFAIVLPLHIYKQLRYA